MTELTIQLPDALAAQLDRYLQENPAETVADVLSHGLQNQWRPKDTSELLALAGIVTGEPRDTAIFF